MFLLAVGKVSRIAGLNRRCNVLTETIPMTAVDARMNHSLKYLAMAQLT
jgi:hypothetical protein